MAVSTSELDNVFFENVPDHFQEALIRCVFSSYQVSAEESSISLPAEEASVLRPQRLWLQLKADLRRMDGRFSELTTTSDRNHVLLTIGQINITASSVPEPGAFVRPAVFRAAYANDSQLDLFESNDPPPPNSQFYGILIHCADPSDLSRPLSAQIAFPDKNLQCWVHKIDLFARHASLVAELRYEPQEFESSDDLVRLRKITKEATG